MADPQTQVLNFLGAFSDKPDFARLRACFSPDAYYQPLVPTLQTYRGHDAIINILRTQYQTYYDCRCEIHTIAANGRSVFTERTDYVILRAGDRRVASRVCAVFEVAETGLIIAWREYWDTADVSRQMSVDVAGVLVAAVGDEQAIA